MKKILVLAMQGGVPYGRFFSDRLEQRKNCLEFLISNFRLLKSLNRGILTPILTIIYPNMHKKEIRKLLIALDSALKDKKISYDDQDKVVFHGEKAGIENELLVAMTSKTPRVVRQAPSSPSLVGERSSPSSAWTDEARLDCVNRAQLFMRERISEGGSLPSRSQLEGYLDRNFPNLPIREKVILMQDLLPDRDPASIATTMKSASSSQFEAPSLSSSPSPRESERPLSSPSPKVSQSPVLPLAPPNIPALRQACIAEAIAQWNRGENADQLMEDLAIKYPQLDIEDIIVLLECLRRGDRDPAKIVSEMQSQTMYNEYLATDISRNLRGVRSSLVVQEYQSRDNVMIGRENWLNKHISAITAGIGTDERLLASLQLFERIWPGDISEKDLDKMPGIQQAVIDRSRELYLALYKAMQKSPAIQERSEVPPPSPGRQGSTPSLSSSPPSPQPPPVVPGSMPADLRAAGPTPTPQSSQARASVGSPKASNTSAKPPAALTPSTPVSPPRILTPKEKTRDSNLGLLIFEWISSSPDTKNADAWINKRIDNDKKFAEIKKDKKLKAALAKFLEQHKSEKGKGISEVEDLLQIFKGDPYFNPPTSR